MFLQTPTPDTSGYMMGAAHFAAEQFEPARAALAASLTASSSWRQADEALLLLARAEAKLNHPAEAMAAAKRLLADFPQSRLRDQAQYRLGEFHYAAGDFPAATAAYQEVLKQWSDSSFATYARYGKVWSLLKAQQYREAATEFSTLLMEQPQHALAARPISRAPFIADKRARRRRPWKI